MSILLNCDTIEAVAAGSTPVAANGGPFASVSESSSTFRASTAIAHPVGGIKTKIIAGTFSGASATCGGIPSAVSAPTTYETIRCFCRYYPVVATGTAVLTIIVATTHFCVYATFGATPKIKATLLDLSSNQTGEILTSQTITQSEWHDITVIYKKVSGTTVSISLIVDGQRFDQVAAASKTPISGAVAYRFGALPQTNLEVNAAAADLFYLADPFVESYDADVSKPRRRSPMKLSSIGRATCSNSL